MDTGEGRTREHQIGLFVVMRWVVMHRFGLHWFGRTGGIPCESMREAISAEIDGEASGIRSKDVRFHVAHCEDCLRFQTGSTALGCQVNLQISRPVPADLKERLAIEMVRAVGPAPYASLTPIVKEKRRP
jgi:hypothetical protein